MNIQCGIIYSEIMLKYVKLTEGYGQISFGTISEEFAKNGESQVSK